MLPGPSARRPRGWLRAAPLRRAARGLRRRGPASPARALAVALVLVAAGGLFATSARTADGSDLRADDTDLRSLVLSQQRQVADRDARVAALHRSVDTAVARVPHGESAATRREVSALSRAAGLDAVTGAGVEVTLADAPPGQARNAGVDSDILIVHQQDLQAVVNALWAGGARAIELQDQRLISTSAVRCVGNTLKLQGRLYAPPYRVTAVGDPADLSAALSASPDVQAYLDDAQRVGLGWTLATHAQLRVPAWAGSLQLLHARPVAPAPSATGSAGGGR